MALLGENGAGKSTLIKSLAGIHTPDEGRIQFKGEGYFHKPPKLNEKQKVAFIHQDLGLVEWMTVAENVGLARGYSRRNGLIDWRATEHRASDALAMVGCDFDPTKRVQDLSRSEKSLVAIARAVNLETFGAGPLKFTAHEGEVLGLAGLRGAGQEAVGRALFGAQASVGEVTLHGATLALSSPQAALRQGKGLVARDRTEESLALSFSVRENVFLNLLSVGRSLLSLLSPSQEADNAHAIGVEVGLRPNDPHLPVEALSGGNQQKVVVGRWLATGRKVLIAGNPTAGVDVGAKAEIYRLIVKALQQGLTVIVISTDIEEVAHICNRVLVFSRGQVVAEIPQDKLFTHALIHAASASEAA